MFCISINYLQSHFVEKEWGWWQASELCDRHQICVAGIENVVAGIENVVAGIGIVTFRRRDALSRNARSPIHWQSKERDQIVRRKIGALVWNDSGSRIGSRIRCLPVYEALEGSSCYRGRIGRARHTSKC